MLFCVYVAKVCVGGGVKKVNNYEKMIFIGVGGVVVGCSVAAFMKKMVDDDYPEIAKLPVKAIDEISQHIKIPECGKAVISVMSRAVEAEVDSYYKAKYWWR